MSHEKQQLEVTFIFNYSSLVIKIYSLYTVVTHKHPNDTEKMLYMTRLFYFSHVDGIGMVDDYSPK